EQTPGRRTDHERALFRAVPGSSCPNRSDVTHVDFASGLRAYFLDKRTLLKRTVLKPHCQAVIVFPFCSNAQEVTGRAASGRRRACHRCARDPGSRPRLGGEGAMEMS